LLPLQALPPPAGGGGPGEQRSPAEIARAALRAPGGGDSTRRGVGASKWRGEDERGWMRDSRRTRQSSPYEAPRRQLERMGASKERSGQRWRGVHFSCRAGAERGNERRGAEAKA
ncbi:unnamed protein product, partial [Prorocentrum cordatum]